MSIGVIFQKENIRTLSVLLLIFNKLNYEDKWEIDAIAEI